MKHSHPHRGRPGSLRPPRLLNFQGEAPSRQPDRPEARPQPDDHEADVDLDAKTALRRERREQRAHRERLDRVFEQMNGRVLRDTMTSLTARAERIRHYNAKHPEEADKDESGPESIDDLQADLQVLRRQYADDMKLDRWPVNKLEDYLADKRAEFGTVDLEWQRVQSQKSLPEELRDIQIEGFEHVDLDLIADALWQQRAALKNKVETVEQFLEQQKQ